MKDINQPCLKLSVALQIHVSGRFYINVRLCHCRFCLSCTLEWNMYLKGVKPISSIDINIYIYIYIYTTRHVRKGVCIYVIWQNNNLSWYDICYNALQPKVYSSRDNFLWYEVDEVILTIERCIKYHNWLWLCCSVKNHARDQQKPIIFTYNFVIWCHLAKEISAHLYWERGTP